MGNNSELVPSKAKKRMDKELICKATSKSNSKWLEIKLETYLIRKGYFVEHIKIVRTDILKATFKKRTILIDVRASKYHSETKGAWYTIKNDGLNKIDYYAFQFKNENDNLKYVIIPREIMKQIVATIPVSRKNVINLKFQVDNGSMIERQSKYDLSENVSKIELVR